MSQKNGQTPRQMKALAKGIPVKSKDCIDIIPPVQNDSSEKQKEEENTADSRDDTDEVDVGCDGPLNKDSHGVTKSNTVTGRENRDSNETKELPRPSAFSPVTPNRDGAEAFKSSVQQTEDSQAPVPTFNHPGFPWSRGTISSSMPLKPFPPLMVPEYSPYLLTDRNLYQPYYVPGNHHINEPNSPSFQPEFLDPQRSIVQQPIGPSHTSPFPPYSYRYCHSLHPGPGLHYTLYRPHEFAMPIAGPRYNPLDLYSPNPGPKDYDLYMHPRLSHNHPNPSMEEDSHSGQNEDKATRLSPKEGCSALGSPDRPSQAHFMQKTTEASQYSNMAVPQTAPQTGHTTTSEEAVKNDSRYEESAEILLQLGTQPVDGG